VSLQQPVSQDARVLSYAGALLETMDAALASHPDVFIMGQGVDDFKGIFGSTTGSPRNMAPLGYSTCP